MAGDESAAEDLPEADGQPAAILARLGVEHVHSRGTAAVVAGFALVHGAFVAWLLGDLLPGLAGFLLGAAVGAYLLYARPTRRGVVARGCYGLAALLVLTPVALEATFLVAAAGAGVADPWAFVLSPVTVLYLVVFALLAAVPAGVGYLLDRRARG